MLTKERYFGGAMVDKQHSHPLKSDASKRVVPFKFSATTGKVNLPRATHLRVGFRQLYINTHTSIAHFDIRPFSGSPELFALNKQRAVWAILVDNSTEDGTWIFGPQMTYSDSNPI